MTAPASDGGQAGEAAHARAGALVSGQTVTPGDFRCTECGQEHTVPADRVENLPVCPRCHSETWETR